MTARLRGDIANRISLAAYLVRMEFERRFAGSAGGRIWVFAGPLLTISVIWVALDFGLGLRASVGPDYGLGLAVGLCCWLFFADGVGSALPSIVGQPHLVKKVVFPVALLPITHVLVAFVVHLLILGVMISLLLGGRGLTVSVLALPFWTACLLGMTVSVALLVAGLNVLVRDASAVVPNLISLFFWLTPIVWPTGRLSPDWAFLAYLNPAAVIIEGYRAALLGAEPLLTPGGTAMFAMGIVSLVVLAFTAFRRMRGQFADVL